MSTHNNPEIPKLFYKIAAESESQSESASTASLAEDPESAPLIESNNSFTTTLGGAPSPEFFIDLDSYTEYWDVYRPDLNGKYMDYVMVVFPKVVPAWQSLCMVMGTAGATQAETNLLTELNKNGVKEAVESLDGLLKELLVKHFPAVEEGSITQTGYLASLDYFARDLFPDDNDRLSRIDSSDGRFKYAKRHTMDGAGMWFAWAAVADCAALYPDLGGLTEHRALEIAGCAAGSALDYTFRGPGRGKTRPQYLKDQPTLDAIHQQALQWAQDGPLARTQVRELYKLYKS